MVLVHVVNVAYRKVDAVGNVLTKDDTAETLKQHMVFDHQYRVIPDPDVPNSANSPTVAAYIQAEAVDDFVVQHIDNTTVITYKRNNADGGFASS
jgi:hypothetical protein